MKKYKYLVVNGCSFVDGGPMLSDYELEYPKSTRYSELTSGERSDFNKTHRFSKLLSDRLGCEEINIAELGGSNDRIFRTTFDWVADNKEKVNKTLFVCGLTSILRRDLYSLYEDRYIVNSSVIKSAYKCSQHATTKSEAEQWYKFELNYLQKESELLKKLLRDCILFDCYIKGLSSNVIFFNSLDEYEVYRRTFRNQTTLDDQGGVFDENINFLKFKNEKYEGNNWTKFIDSYRNNFTFLHPNEDDHKMLSSLLYKYIKENFK